MRSGHRVDLSEFFHSIAGPLQPDLIVPRLHSPILHDDLCCLLVINNNCDRVWAAFSCKPPRNLAHRLPQVFFLFSGKRHLNAPAVPMHPDLHLSVHIVIHFFLLF